MRSQCELQDEELKKVTGGAAADAVAAEAVFKAMEKASALDSATQNSVQEDLVALNKRTFTVDDVRTAMKKYNIDI